MCLADIVDGVFGERLLLVEGLRLLQYVLIRRRSSLSTAHASKLTTVVSAILFYAERSTYLLPILKFDNVIISCFSIVA